MQNTSSTSQQDSVLRILSSEEFKKAVKIFKEHKLLPKEGFNSKIFANKVLEHTDHNLQKAIEFLGSVEELKTKSNTSKLGAVLFSLLGIASCANMVYNKSSENSPESPSNVLMLSYCISFALASSYHRINNSNERSQMREKFTSIYRSR